MSPKKLHLNNSKKLPFICLIRNDKFCNLKYSYINIYRVYKDYLPWGTAKTTEEKTIQIF